MTERVSQDSTSAISQLDVPPADGGLRLEPREIPRHEYVSGELAEVIPLARSRPRREPDPLYEAALLIEEIAEEYETADTIDLSNRFDEWRRILSDLPCDPSADGVDFVDLVALVQNATHKLDLVDVTEGQLEALAAATQALRDRGAVRASDLERAHARLREAGLRSRLFEATPEDPEAYLRELAARLDEP